MQDVLLEGILCLWLRRFPPTKEATKLQLFPGNLWAEPGLWVPSGLLTAKCCDSKRKLIFAQSVWQISGWFMDGCLMVNGWLICAHQWLVNCWWTNLLLQSLPCSLHSGKKTLDLFCPSSSIGNTTTWLVYLGPAHRGTIFVGYHHSQP